MKKILMEVSAEGEGKKRKVGLAWLWLGLGEASGGGSETFNDPEVYLGTYMMIPTMFI
jgi:hypothetical protein